MRGVAYGLGGLAIGAQEAAAHPLPVTKTGFARNFLDWEPALFKQVTRGFEAKILHGARGRLTRFHSEHAGELPWA